MICPFKLLSFEQPNIHHNFIFWIRFFFLSSLIVRKIQCLSESKLNILRGFMYHSLKNIWAQNSKSCPFPFKMSLKYICDGQSLDVSVQPKAQKKLECLNFILRLLNIIHEINIICFNNEMKYLGLKMSKNYLMFILFL